MTEPQNNPTLEQSIQLLHQIFEQLIAFMHQKAEDDLQYFDNADLKRKFNLSDSTLHRLRKKNEIPYFKLGGRILYPKSYFTKAFRQ